jgi:predicted nucleotidyltransferase
MHVVANIDREALRASCERWPIPELARFGSALREDFGPESDLDFLVVYTPGAKVTLLDEAQMVEELEVICGRPVDLVSKKAVEHSKNWIRRKAILESAVVVYPSE